METGAAVRRDDTSGFCAPLKLNLPPACLVVGGRTVGRSVVAGVVGSVAIDCTRVLASVTAVPKEKAL